MGFTWALVPVKFPLHGILTSSTSTTSPITQLSVIHKLFERALHPATLLMQLMRVMNSTGLGTAP